MKFDPQRTIVALSSGANPGRRAIVRLSGRQTSEILRGLFVGEHDHELLKATVPRAQDVCCSLTWPGRTVAARAYYWPDSRSFTGEPCAELHLIGSLPVAEALIGRLCELGAAYAERGEFTLRSFLAGKIDLTQAEAVLGVIEAEGEAELQAALAQLGGNLSRPVRNMRDELLELIAHLEAGLDFVEEDIEFISTAELTRQLKRINGRIESLITQIDTRDARTAAIQIVIVGLPNAGKSSLFNALVGNDRAIVSPLAGTTRDVISQRTAIGSLEVELIDTAGLEELDDATPRAAAQTVLLKRLRNVDLALLCCDSSAALQANWMGEQLEWLHGLGLEVISVGTKADARNATAWEDSTSHHFDVLVSSRTGIGLEELQQLMQLRLSQHQRQFQSEAMQFTAIRCVRGLKLAQTTLRRAIELSEVDAGEELVAAELRVGLDDLSAIIGEVHSDDILGEIFSRFCIGK